MIKVFWHEMQLVNTKDKVLALAEIERLHKITASGDGDSDVVKKWRDERMSAQKEKASGT